MKVTMMLCDFAEASEGKLHIIGAGWSIKGPDTPMGLAIKIEVPWNEANRTHHLCIRLLGQDGEVVTFDSPVGPQPVEIEMQFEVGRPPGLPEGTPLDSPLAINMGALPLPPNARFEWRLMIDGESKEDWHVSFMTRG